MLCALINEMVDLSEELPEEDEQVAGSSRVHDNMQSDEPCRMIFCLNFQVIFEFAVDKIFEALAGDLTPVHMAMIKVSPTHYRL